MLIDGTPRLACVTKLEPGEHTFEPLTGFPVIRDLVVDRSSAYQQFTASRAANLTVDRITKVGDMDYDLYMDVLEPLNLCKECCCCYAIWNEGRDPEQPSRFVGPGAMMQIGARHLDPHDQADRVSQAVFSGLYEFDDWNRCSGVCPAFIDFARIADILKQAAEERGLKPADAE